MVGNNQMPVILSLTCITSDHVQYLSVLRSLSMLKLVLA